MLSYLNRELDRLHYFYAGERRPVVFIVLLI
jgi:hypothetical protein